MSNASVPRAGQTARINACEHVDVAAKRRPGSPKQLRVVVDDHEALVGRPPLCAQGRDRTKERIPATLGIGANDDGYSVGRAGDKSIASQFDIVEPLCDGFHTRVDRVLPCCPVRRWPPFHIVGRRMMPTNPQRQPLPSGSGGLVTTPTTITQSEDQVFHHVWIDSRRAHRPSQFQKGSRSGTKRDGYLGGPRRGPNRHLERVGDELGTHVLGQ